MRNFRYQFDTQKLRDLVLEKQFSPRLLRREIEDRCPAGSRPVESIIKRWLSGESKPSANYIGILAAALDVSVSDLYKRVDL